MNKGLRTLIVLFAALALPAIAQEAKLPKGFVASNATVNGARIHYLVGGKGPVVVLLRGFGGSERTPGGYDKKTMAQDVHALVQKLGHDKVKVVGHDIGLMVAYAYVAQYPAETQRVILMDAFLPGVGDWQHVWLLRDLWHFHFYGETPLALVKGRERIYFEHFWNDFAADRTKSVSEADRQLYAKAYARDGGMRAGFEVFRNFEQDAKDFAVFAQTKLDMPFLVLAGEKASGTFLIEQTKLVAKNVTGVVIPGSGHWLMDEARDQVMPKIVEFLNAPGI